MPANHIRFIEPASVRGHGPLLRCTYPAVGAGCAREPIPNHRAGSIRGQGPLLQMPVPRRRSVPCARISPEPSSRLLFAAMGRSYKCPNPAVGAVRGYGCWR